MNEKEIYKQAIEIYGVTAQITMVFEEMAELQKELCKSLRGKDNAENIAEEIADVQIMLEQMKQLYEIEKDVDYYKEYKLKRLKNRLKD